MFFEQGGGFGHLLGYFTFNRAKIGVAQHGNNGLLTQSLNGLCSRYGDLYQLFGCWVWIY